MVGRYKTIDTTSMFDKFESLPCGLRMFLMNYINQLKYCLKKQPYENKTNSIYYDSCPL